jgi:Domain of unknown function (DUF397)
MHISFERRQMSEMRWQKSSFSEGNGSQCIELARHADGIALRESDAPGVIVTSDRTSLRSLIVSVKTGAFDHLA